MYYLDADLTIRVERASLPDLYQTQNNHHVPVHEIHYNHHEN